MTALVDNAAVVTANGLRGTAQSRLPAGVDHAGLVRVTLDTGRELWVAPSMLVRQPEGHYLLPVAVPAEAAERVETVVVPVLEEQAVVEKRSVPAGGVRVTKVVHERDEMVDTTGVTEEIDVVREPAGVFVEQAEPARVDGDRTIIPVYEEVVVVEKRLRLKERWVITRRRVETPGTQALKLRREEAVVERLEPDSQTGQPPV